MLTKVSIIVPVFNSEAFIEECLDSILKQSYNNIEVIIIDDGSTDNSSCLLHQYEKNDCRIKVVHTNNQGVSAARNLGIQLSSGDYLVFVDSDDIIAIDMIDCLLKYSESRNADIIVGNIAYKYEKRILPRIPRVKSGSYTVDDLYNRLIDDGSMTGILFGSACANMYSSHFLKEKGIRFVEKVRINEDGIFNIECLINGAIFYQVNDQSMYLYRQWKNCNNYKTNCIDKMIEYDVSDKVLLSIIQNRMPLETLKHQFKLRRVTEIFQISVSMCENGSYRVTKEKIRSLWISEYESIESCKKDIKTYTNKYKYLLYQCMCKKQYLLYYLVIKYVYPVLKKIIRR